MDPNEENELTTLEEPTTNVTSGPDTPAGPTVHEAPTAGTDQTAIPKPKHNPFKKLKNFGILKHVNIYLIIFLVLVVATVSYVIYAARQNTKDNGATLISGSLSEEELSNLKGTDAKVGDPKQTLSIESNAIFSGKVLVRDSLDVAGTIKVGDSLNLPGITVGGNSAFDQVQANQLNVSGSTTLQGQVNIQQNLNVTGGASFGGPISAPQLNIQTLQLSGDLQLNRHIDAGGSTPSRSNGGALGNGGSSSVSGSDTAGTVAFSTGGSPSAGCYANVSFAQRYNSTPHVVVTPVGSESSSLNYYVNRSNTGFSLCASNTPAAGTSFTFDYIVID